MAAKIINQDATPLDIAILVMMPVVIVVILGIASYIGSAEPEPEAAEAAAQVAE